MTLAGDGHHDEGFRRFNVTVASEAAVNAPTAKEFMLAAGGSIAVALGFALKDIAASLVAGLLLLFDRPFRVGDRVSFADVYGEIVSIGLRTVRLQTLDDNLVTIPNSRFITDVVASGNSGELDMMLGRAAEHQEREVETLRQGVMGILGPAVILAMGGLVLIIVLAILLPVFNLNQLVK